MINLLDIQPNVVSRDLREKIVMIYGDPKTGKTTTACKFPKPILIAFEKGYNAIGGVYAVPINKWTEFKTVLKQLKTDQVKEKFETVVVDTVDIAYDLCEKYVCQKEGVDNIKDIPFGGGYAMVEKEYDEALRSIALEGYGLVTISHATDKPEKDEKGEDYSKIVPTLNKRASKVVTRMADIIGYSRGVKNDEGEIRTLLFMRGTDRYVAGSRFKYTPSYIELTYQNLVNAIADAIEKQEKEDGDVVVDKKESIYAEQTHFEFDEVMEEIQATIGQLMADEKLQEVNAPKITEIVEIHLGKGKKVSQATKDQADILALILSDMKDLL